MATFNLTGQLRFTASLTDTLATADLVDSVTIVQSLTLGDGGAVGQAQNYWRDVRTVAGSSTDIVDRENLPKSVFGGSGNAALQGSSVRLLYVKNLSSSIGLTLQFAANSTPLPAGGIALFYAPGGGAFTDNTLAIQNATATPAQYEIVIVGINL